MANGIVGRGHWLNNTAGWLWGRSLQPSGRHRASNLSRRARVRWKALASVAVGVGIVGLGWMAVDHIGTTASDASDRSVQQPGVTEPQAWVRANLPGTTRLLTDGPTPPAGYAVGSLPADQARWHDFDYLMTGNTSTLPAPMDADVPALWRFSVPVAVFDGVQIRRILPADNEIQQTREADRADRLLAGSGLLSNAGISVSPGPKAALARGALDLRAATVLATLADRVQVTLDDVVVVPAEDAAGVPARTILIHVGDAAQVNPALSGLTTPLRPDDVSRGDNGVMRLHWPLSFTRIPSVN